MLDWSNCLGLTDEKCFGKRELNLFVNSKLGFLGYLSNPSIITKMKKQDNHQEFNFILTKCDENYLQCKQMKTGITHETSQ